MSKNIFDGFEGKKKKGKTTHEGTKSKVIGRYMKKGDKRKELMDLLQFIGEELYIDDSTNIVAVITESTDPKDGGVSLGMALPSLPMRGTVDRDVFRSLIKAVSDIARRDDGIHAGIARILDTIGDGDTKKIEPTSAKSLRFSSLLNAMQVERVEIVQKCHPHAGLLLSRDGSGLSGKCSICGDEIIRLTE